MRVVIATSALLGLITSHVHAAVLVGDNIYKYLPSGGQTVSQAVQAAYAAGKRPALRSEWPSILGNTNGNSLSQALDYPIGAPGNGAAVLYDESNEEFVVANLLNQNEPVPIAAVALSPGLVVLDNAAVNCSGTSTPINILDAYPNVPLTDVLVDACMCYSQYSGRTCSQLTTALNCPGAATSALAADTGQQVIRGGTDGGNINGLQETVEFTIDSPQVAFRNYTSFNWGNCASGGALTNSALRKYQSATEQSSCQDSFQFGYRVSDLVSVCGLEEGNFMYDGSQSGVVNDSWVRYRGDLMIYYVEWASVASIGGVPGVNTLPQLSRRGRLVTPIDVYIQRTFAAELTTDTSIQLLSPFQLRAAITATVVKANHTTTTVDLTLGISNPYQIMYMSNQYSSNIFNSPPVMGLEWESIGDTEGIKGAYFLDQNRSLVTTPTLNLFSGAGLSDCTAYDANNICWRTVQILVVTDATCTLDHIFTIETIAIGCNPQYQGPDCPLPGLDTSSSASFTVKASDYCDGQRGLVINGAIVVKAYVPQKQLSRTNPTAAKSFLINDMLWLVLFLDSDRSLRVFSLTPIQLETKFDTNGSYTVPPEAGQYIANSFSQLQSTFQPGMVQGFDIDTQTYAMEVQLNCNFVVDITGTCLIKPNANGILQGRVYARLTFVVDYEGASSDEPRRRRRQVTNEKGYAAMATEMDLAGDTAAIDMAPSSAERLGRPAGFLLVAIALLSNALLVMF